MNQVRDTDRDCSLVGGGPGHGTTSTATISSVNGGTTTAAAGTTGTAVASGATPASTGTPVTPLFVGLELLAIGGLIVLRGDKVTT